MLILIILIMIIIIIIIKLTPNKVIKGDKLVIKLKNLIQNIFQEHANGINFIERYAGKERDNLMLKKGFNLKIFFLIYF